MIHSMKAMRIGAYSSIGARMKCGWDTITTAIIDDINIVVNTYRTLLPLAKLTVTRKYNELPTYFLHLESLQRVLSWLG